ncbi:hypothetical protein AZH51_08235 [Branchiibius sp. NY16-3462-2]|nr:hypothetical protein AZH51_08235 [Branchiibius sp. NY16-3462-2]
MVGVVLWLAIEIAVLYAVAHLIGWGPALLVLLGLSFAGISITRHQLTGALRTWRQGGTRSRYGAETVVTPIDPGSVGGSAVGIAASVLMTVPGFVSAVVGALLLVPWVRRTVGRLLAGVVTARAVSVVAAVQQPTVPGQTSTGTDDVRNGLPIIEGEIVKE